MIEIRHLSKSYGKLKAVNDLSFTVPKGQMFGFLGINGAGKSTVLNMICGLLDQDEGTIRINGMESERNREILHHMIGAVYQYSALDGPLTVTPTKKCPNMNIVDCR